MTRSVDVVVYEIHFPGTDEVYVGSTVQELSKRLTDHRCKPCVCYAHLNINQAEIVSVLKYTTSDRFNRRPEAAHKALLRSKNITVLVNPNDQHHTPLWYSEAAKAKIGASHKGNKNYQYAPFTVTFPDGTIDRWETTGEAAAAYGVSHMSVWNYLRGKSTPGGNKHTSHLKDTVWQYV